MSRLKIGLLGALVFLVGLVALFPATLAVRWFAPSVPGLAIGPLDGTIWDGDAASVEYRDLVFDHVNWSVNPLGLLALGLDVELSADRASRPPLHADIDVAPSGAMEIENLNGTLRLAELAKAGFLPRNVARGDVMLDVDALHIQDGRIVAATGRAGLVNLESALLAGVPLGSYEGQFETGNDVVVATFSDVDAPLRLNGRAELRPDGSYTASGSITPTAQTPDALRQGLRLLGQPDASGRYDFRFEGRL